MRSESTRVEADVFAQVLGEAGGQPLQAAPAPAAAPVAPAVAVPTLRPLAEQVAALEARVIADAMRALGGNKVAVAKALGISRATLYARIGLSEK